MKIDELKTALENRHGMSSMTGHLDKYVWSLEAMIKLLPLIERLCEASKRHDLDAAITCLPIAREISAVM